MISQKIPQELIVSNSSNRYNVCRPLNSHGFTVCHTFSVPFSRSHGRFFIYHGFANFEQIFSHTHSFLKKNKTKKQAAHSNDAEERISRTINKNKTSSRSSLYLNWKLLLITLVKTHIDNPFSWNPPSDLLKIMKKITGEYDGQHSSN